MKKPVLQYSSRPVAVWLLIGVGMLVVQILLGGITRLSGSGLSITEWNVITGALPPLNEQQWVTEFEKYRQTPQFHLLNFDFTLKDFKFIFLVASFLGQADGSGFLYSFCIISFATPV
jgi:heme a synthase